ncbi:MAG: hypothetical protein ABSC19_17100 [Syntrophorhabdales bacterium]|jgi:hypothetical protein
MAACPNALAHRLKSSAQNKGTDADARLFGIKRKKTWQIVAGAADEASIRKGPLSAPPQLHPGHGSPATIMGYA